MVMIWQGNDTATEPTFSRDLRAQLQATLNTAKFDTREFDFEAKALAGNALLKSHSTVIFALVDTGDLLPIRLADQIVIGRQGFDTSDAIDIDLGPYGGRDRGVSRCHAALYQSRHTVTLADLKSTNGTYLNGIRLVPHQPRLLREGDEVRLGNMRFHVYFGE